MTRTRTALIAIGGAAAFAAAAALAALGFLDWRAEEQSRVFEERGASCAAGDRDVCSELGRACANDSGPACLALADRALKNGPRHEALRLLDKACELDLPLGCLRAGRLRLESGSDPKEGDRARRSLERGCALGNQEACRLAHRIPGSS